MVCLTKSSTKDSSLLRVTLMFKCIGSEASAVTWVKLMSVCCTDDDSKY
jgi:hypothetical protein